MEPVILIGRTVPNLGWKIATQFPYNSKPINPNIICFANKEIFCKLEASVRGSDCFVIQSICNWKDGSVNDALMELLIMIETLKRSSAKSVTAVIPHLGYARQDRRAETRTPITSKLIAKLIETAGADKIVTMDMHCLQGEGFFDIPVDNLEAENAFIEILEKDFNDLFSNECCIVSPDAGGMRRARKYAEKLNVDVAMIDKRRSGINKTEVMNIIGSVKNKKCFLIDDIIDTGGTIIIGAEALLEQGATSISAICTHPVFSKDAISILSSKKENKQILTNIYYSNTIPFESKGNSIFKEVDVSRLFVQTLNKIIAGE